MTQTADSYSAEDIQVLEGLEAVRKRPGMYIGSTGPTGLHHLVYEVVDNAVDEAMAGHCTQIEVEILKDGACEVRDNGRGIPVGTHHQYEDLSAAEVVLTVLHAGGKFGGDGYKVSGGLHGVGVSVVNALSSKVEVEIQRDGKQHFMSFKDGGEPDEKLAVTGKASKDTTGTTVRFWPDIKIFKEGIDFRATTLLERFQMMAFLNKGLEIIGILMTMYDSRLNLSKQVVNEVNSFFKDKLFKTYIHRNVRLSEAPSFGKPALLYDANSTGAQNYMSLTEEILQRVSQ